MYPTRDVSEFVTKYMVCQKVKAEHQVPLGLLHLIRIPEWRIIEHSHGDPLKN